MEYIINIIIKIVEGEVGGKIEGEVKKLRIGKKGKKVDGGIGGVIIGKIIKMM